MNLCHQSRSCHCTLNKDSKTVQIIQIPLYSSSLVLLVLRRKCTDCSRESLLFPLSVCEVKSDSQSLLSVTRPQKHLKDFRMLHKIRSRKHAKSSEIPLIPDRRPSFTQAHTCFWWNICLSQEAGNDSKKSFPFAQLSHSQCRSPRIHLGGQLARELASARLSWR